MKTIVGAISALALSLSIAATEIRADPGTPAEQYAALFKEYGPVSVGMREATTDLERKAAVESLGTYPSKFLDLAEKYPEDPIALKALRQAVQAMSSTDSGAQIAWETNRSNFPGGSNDGSAARTVALLMRDHVLSAEIGPVCDRLRYSYRLESEEFLRAVLETNPHREMQGLACLFLARFLNDRLRMVQLAEDRPDLARRFEIVFGKDYLPKLQRLKQDGLAGTIEALFERAAEDYGDVKTSTGGTAGEQAKSELYDIRHLAIGMAARDIEGRDQDGIEFKLSDYRGKVVLLYFWLEF